MFRMVLRGGPPLAGDDASARLVGEQEPAVVIVRWAADGTQVRFRISGDYELIEGLARRVYFFVPPKDER